MYDEVDRLKEDEQKAVAAEPEERNGGVVFALILIGLGVYFLAHEFLGFELFENWWALFILIPAAGCFGAAWSQHKATGQWRGAAAGSLLAGVILTTVAVSFLLGLGFGRVWPVLLIVFGISLLLRA
jgi:hypothetical protein